MKVSDGRKLRQAKIKAKNRETIVKWFSKNPGSTITECCKGVKMSFITVKRHIDEIQIREKYYG